jgi:tetratricopeptide (TPR) repeat protein
MDHLKWWHVGVLTGLGLVALGTIGYLTTSLGIDEEPQKKRKQKKVKGIPRSVRTDANNRTEKERQSLEDRVQIFDILLKQAQKAKDEGDYPLAEDYAKRAVRFASETLGPNAEFTGLVYYMLYEIYYERHKLQEAEEALLNARLCLKNTKDQQELYNAIVIHLADLYNLQERYSDAEPLFEEAVTYLEKSGTQPPNETSQISLGITLSSLAYTKSRLQKFAEAEVLFKKAFDIIVSRMGFADMFSVHCALRYGQVLIDQGKVDVAEKLFKDCLQKAEQEKALNDDIKFNLVPLMHGLGELYFELGNYAEAESYWLKSQQIAKEQSYDQHILCDLANLYWQTGRNDEAKALLEQLKTRMGSKPQLLIPRSTSKYLRTREVSLESGTKPNVYRIKLEIKRDISSREAAEKRTLKLKPGTFFEFHFQNPEKETDPIIKTVELKEGENVIEVTTEPVMFVKDQQWYEIEVFIFADKTKQTKLGVHHQLVKALDSDLEPPSIPQYKTYLEKLKPDTSGKPIPIQDGTTKKEPNMSGL